MPWKDVTVMDERIRFVARLLEGEQMAGLCREFGISRKTGYKIFDRYKECGVEAISDRPRRPYRYGNQLPSQIESMIVSMKRNKPHWGARKANNPQQSWGFDGEPPQAVISDLLQRIGLYEAPSFISNWSSCRSASS